MKRAELLREHARTMLNIAESTRGEDHACLQSVAHGWFRAADKLERVDQQERLDQHTKRGKGGSPCISRLSQ
jgi:hypothetical protein